LSGAFVERLGGVTAARNEKKFHSASGAQYYAEHVFIAVRNNGRHIESLHLAAAEAAAAAAARVQSTSRRRNSRVEYYVQI
jgi:hypothetical protein